MGTAVPAAHFNFCGTLSKFLTGSSMAQISRAESSPSSASGCTVGSVAALPSPGCAVLEHVLPISSRGPMQSVPCSVVSLEPAHVDRVTCLLQPHLEGYCVHALCKHVIFSSFLKKCILRWFSCYHEDSG